MAIDMSKKNIAVSIKAFRAAQEVFDYTSNASISKFTDNFNTRIKNESLNQGVEVFETYPNASVNTFTVTNANINKIDNSHRINVFYDNQHLSNNDEYDMTRVSDAWSVSIYGSFDSDTGIYKPYKDITIIS